MHLTYGMNPEEYAEMVELVDARHRGCAVCHAQTERPADSLCGRCRTSLGPLPTPQERR
jgi:hypothetical protein